MNKRFKPGFPECSAGTLKEYVCALGEESSALLSTSMLADLDIHVADDASQRPKGQRLQLELTGKDSKHASRK